MIVALFCATFFTTNAKETVAETEYGNNENAQTENYAVADADFHMLAGASIRTEEGSSGIRFVAEFSKEFFDEVRSSENKQFGMLITKLEYYKRAISGSGDLIEGLNNLGKKSYALITEESANPVRVYRNIDDDNNETYRINGALTNIKYDHADWKWIGVGVVITEAEDGTSYVYAAHSVKDNARTASYVASAALSDTSTEYTEAQQTTLKNYVYKTAAYQQEVSEETFNNAADKSVYLSGYKLNVGNTLDTSHKYNSQVDGKEAYLTIGGDSVDLSAEVSKDGKVLDLAYFVSSSNTDALQVKDKKITALKDGYSTLTLSCGQFNISETITVYTGSTDAGNRASSRQGANEGATEARAIKSTLKKDGETYYWEQGAGTDTQHLFASYSDISVYYIDYLIEQGYKYLRIPFYFDTTRYAELNGSAKEVGTPYFTIWMAKQLNGSAEGSSKIVYVNANESSYYNMDIHHYRMNFTEIDNAGIDKYGQKLKASSYYQYLNMKFSCKYGWVYVGEMTFVKESGANIKENGSAVSFGDEVDLTKRYVSDTALTYKVNGEKTSSFTAVKASNKIEINQNIYTAKIGDKSYTLGNAAAWSVDYQKSEVINKTIKVEGGINAENTKLIDVNELGTDVAGISIADYTDSKKLEDLGFTVTQTYKKRYSDVNGNFSEKEDLISLSERGLFYVSVLAKGTQEIHYEVTLDIYDSTEPVEYESFAHDDSKYAVSAYYAVRNAADSTSLTAKSVAFKSYDYLKTEIVDGKTLWGTDLHGKEMSCDEWFVINQFGNASTSTYGETTFAQGDNDGSVATLKSIYGDSYTDYNGIFTYLAMDVSQISATSPIEIAIGYDSALSIYVTPRHSKEYYAAYANDLSAAKLKYSFAVPYYSKESKSGIIYALKSVTNGEGTFTKQQCWSENWQGKGYRDTIEVTLDTIISNYDAFATRNFPMIVCERPQGFSSSNTHNGNLKLGALLF